MRSICKRIRKCFRCNSFDAVFIYLVHGKAKITPTIIIIPTIVKSKYNECKKERKVEVDCVQGFCAPPLLHVAAVVVA